MISVALTIYLLPATAYLTFLIRHDLEFRQGFMVSGDSSDIDGVPAFTLSRIYPFRHLADFCFDGVDCTNLLGILRVSLRHLALFPQFCFLYLVTFLRLDALLYVVQCKSHCIVSLLCEVSTFLPSCQLVPSTQLTPTLQR